MGRTVHDQLFTLAKLGTELINDPKMDKFTTEKHLTHEALNAYYYSTTKEEFMPPGTLNKYWSVYINTTAKTREVLAGLSQMDVWYTYSEIYLPNLQVAAKFKDYIARCKALSLKKQKICRGAQPSVVEPIATIGKIYPSVFR